MNTKALSSYQLTLAYITIFLWIVWRPFSLMVIHFDAGQRVSILFLVLCLFFTGSLLVKFIFTKPNSLLSWVCIYGFVNAIIKHSALLEQDNGYFYLMYHTVMPFLLFVIAILCFENDFEKTVRVVSRALVVYSIITTAFAGNITGNERMESGSININEVVLYCLCGVSFMFLRYVRGQISKTEMLTVAFPIFVSVMAGSRMGLLTLFIIVIGLLSSKLDFKKTGTFIFLIVGSIVLYFGIDYILHNTFAGERVLGTQNEVNDRYADFKTGTILDLLGDRGFMYYYSWPLFLEHPITGIGLYNYIQYSPWGMRLHTEYATQYVENGLLGFIPFISFLIILLKKLKITKKENKILNEVNSIKMIFFILSSVLFSNLVLWSFDMVCVYLVYAMVAVYPSHNSKLHLK